MNRTARIGSLLLALAPLAFWPGIFTHDDIPKRPLVLAAALLLLVAWIRPALQLRRLDVRRDPMILPLLLTWAAGVGSTVFCTVTGGNPCEAYWPILLSTGGVLVYLSVSNTGEDDRFYRETLPTWIVGAACVVAVYGLVQRAGLDPLHPVWANPDREAGSTLGGKTYAGEYLALVIPLAVSRVLTTASAAGRWTAAAAAMLLCLHLLLTEARGAWAGAGIGTGAFLILGLVKRFGPEQRRAVPPAAAGILFGVLLAAALTAQATGSIDWIGRLREVVSPEPGRDTGLVRRELWTSSVRMAADHPILGVGPGQYALRIQPYRSAVEMREADPQRIGRVAGMAHNDFLHRLAETGAFGGAVVVLLLYAFVRKSAGHLRGQGDRVRYLQAAGMVSGILAVSIAGLVGNPLLQPAVGGLVMLYLGMAERSGNPSAVVRSIALGGPFRGLCVVGACLAIVVLILSLARVGVDILYAGFMHHRVVMAKTAAPTPAHLARLHASRKTLEGVMAPIALLWARWDVHRALGLSYLDPALGEDRDAAAAHLSRTLALHPADAETWNAWGMLCRRRGRADEGRRAFESAVRLDPIVRKPRMNLALAFEQDGMPDRAMAQYVILLRLDPGDADAHFGRAHVLARLDRHAEAAEAFEAAGATGYRHGGMHVREVVKRMDALRGFRESEAGRAWLERGP